MSKTSTLFLWMSISFFAVLNVRAQDAVKKPIVTSENIAPTSDSLKKSNWKFGGSIAINFNQQNSSNWVGATEKYAIALGFSSDLFANLKHGKSSLENTLKMNYAYLNNQSQGLRKTSDFIDLLSKYGIELQPSGKLVFATVANLRTQFTNGYDYSLTPRRRTSGFFAPASLLLTPGFEWRPNAAFSIFASPVAARWVFVTNDPNSYRYPNGQIPGGGIEKPIADLYGVDASKKVNGQFGAFVSVNFKKDILKNVGYTTRLDLYANYLDNPQNVDVFWTNNLVLKVNKWLAVTYQFNIAYDDNFTPQGLNGPSTQFLGNFGIGISGKL